MKKMLVPVMLILALSGCSRTVTIDADITWTDNTLFTSTGDWYAVLSVGSYILNGIDGVDYVEVTPGTSTVASFSIDASEGDFFSVSVFLDANRNGVYDSESDWVTGTGEEWADPGDDISFSVEAYY